MFSFSFLEDVVPANYFKLKSSDTKYYKNKSIFISDDYIHYM